MFSLSKYFKPYLKINKINNFSNSMLLLKHTVVLGIETSCDDTGCAIVDESGRILGESLNSQTLIHLRHGGINPIIAREFHRNNIEKVVSNALDKASMKIEDINAIAVTTKPGLPGSLEIGVKYANYISQKYNKMLVPIHHMKAHALVARMYNNIDFPFLVLLISGGHCLLALVNDVDNFHLLGQTIDNPPGEILDKCARRMKLRNIPKYSHMPGGQAIEMAALNAKNPTDFTFPLPLARNRDCNFSFSGLQDAFIRLLTMKEKEHNLMGDNIIPEVNDLCAAFQMAVAKHLVQRTQRAAQFLELKSYLPNENKTLVVSGGVACNNFIFKSLETFGTHYNYKVVRPPPNVCTDNGVMIAWNGIEILRKGCQLDNKEIDPKAPLGKNIIDQVKLSNLPTKLVKLKYFY